MKRLVHGMTRINEHCTFSWQESDRFYDYRGRTYRVTSRHCKACIAELRRGFDGARFVFARGTKLPPNE